MERVDLIIHPKWIIPIEPAGVVLTDHSMVIHHGRIKALLPKAGAAKQYQAAHEVVRPHHVLCPGFVNAHTHLAMSLLRGYADDLTLMDWLQNHIWPAEKKQVNPAFISLGTKLGLLEFLRSGTTCFNDMYFFPEITADIAKKIGVRAVIGFPIMKFETPWSSDEADGLGKAAALLAENEKNPLISYALAPHSIYATTDDALKKIAAMAHQMNLLIHAHVQETAVEVQQSLAETGLRPLQRFEQHDLLSSRFLAVHMTQIDDSDEMLLAKYGVHVAHCPSSNLKLASGFCPVHRLQSAGVNVCLGTDGAASNNTLDLMNEMHIASLLGKAVANYPEAVSTHVALRMATLSGAEALGLAQEIGSFIPGKAADMITVDLSEANTQPVFDPASHLVYAAHSAQVNDVWIAGQCQLEHGRFVKMNAAEVLAQVQAWKLKASLAS